MSWATVLIGPDLEVLADRVAPGRVTFHGLVDGPTVIAAMASAVVVVVSSVVPENMPLTILEASSVGTPVVASALGGSLDLIDHGETGLLVPPGDAVAVAAAVGRFLDNQTWARECGVAARTRVEERHHPERHLAAIEAVYEEAMERRRTS